MSETLQKYAKFPLFGSSFYRFGKTSLLLTASYSGRCFYHMESCAKPYWITVLLVSTEKLKFLLLLRICMCFVSYVFNLIFGKENFIYPLLIFNSLLFTIGSYFLSKLILENPVHQAIFHLFIWHFATIY